MIIYNVTIKVGHEIAKEWLSWLQKEHIPEMIETGCFDRAIVLRLLETDEEDGVTYAVQYNSESEELYHQYIEKFAEEMRKKGNDKWGNKFIAFRTLMEVVN